VTKQLTYRLQNSLVFVSHKHGIWERKPSKRYGLLRQSPKTELSEMLSEHKEEVFTWIANRADEATDEEEDEKDEKYESLMKE
jgi:histone deacetylase 6